MRYVYFVTLACGGWFIYVGATHTDVTSSWVVAMVGFLLVAGTLAWWMGDMRDKR